MLQRLKREVCFLILHYKVLGLCAFLCCMGGVLLWVSGGSLFHHIRGEILPLGVLFLLWLTAYGLTGLLIGVLLLSGGKYAGTATALTAAAYVFMLCWYAVFCCTPLKFFACILLILSVTLIASVFPVCRRGMLTLKILIIFIEGLQLLCLYRCFFIYLLI